MKRKDPNLIRIKELALLSGQIQTTIKYYADLGLIPFVKFNDGLRASRFFEKETAVERVKLILKLKKKRYYITEIAEHIKKIDGKREVENEK